MSAAEIIPSFFIKDADFERVAKLFSAELAEPNIDPEKVEHLLKQIRNLFVLSVELRRIAVDNGIHLRVLDLMRQPNALPTLSARSEALLVLTCLYRSNLLTADNFPLSSPEFLSLIYFGVFKAGEEGGTNDLKSKLACLLALLHHSCLNPSFLLSDSGNKDQNQSWLGALLGLVSKSENEMEASSNFAPSEHLSLCLILQIIARGCQDQRVQDVCLTSFPSLVQILAILLGPSNQAPNARLCAVDCLAAICRKNQRNSREILSLGSSTSENENKKVVANFHFNFIEALLTFTNRDQPLLLQLAAAKCLVNICEMLTGGEPTSQIQVRICENLVRLVRPDRPSQIRIEAAQILTDFIESAIILQRITGMCDGLISIISSTLSNSSAPNSGGGGAGNVLLCSKEALDLDMQNQDVDETADDLTAPFLHLSAAICANDEFLRRKVSESSELISVVFSSVRSCQHGIQIAGLRCLLSLSRSAYQLRTTFSDHQANLSKDLLVILKINGADCGVLAACLALLCNLFLSTAQVKRAFLAPETIPELLSRIIGFASHSDLQVRINAVWALMNLTYQGPPSMKHHIYSCLSRENLFTLLSDVKTPMIVSCALGLIRNLIDGTASEVDTGMAHYGDQVVQSAIWILEGDYPVDVKEQVLRIIANMASGERSRDALLGNDDLLRKVMDYMLHVNLNVQIAAIDALTNLTLDSDSGDYVGSLKRWQILETCGFIRVLNEMLSTTTELALYSKVKRLIELFSQHRFGICS